MLTGYENSFPPNFPNQTEINVSVFIENTIGVDEKNMLFSVTMDITSVWMDSRLSYTDAVTKKSSIEITSQMQDIWKPQIQVTDNVKDEGRTENIYFLDVLAEHLTLFKNGTLLYSRRMNIDLQ